MRIRAVKTMSKRKKGSENKGIGMKLDCDERH